MYLCGVKIDLLTGIVRSGINKPNIKNRNMIPVEKNEVSILINCISAGL